jgi:phospholipid-binding lipoprotein MlaA
MARLALGMLAAALALSAPVRAEEVAPGSSGQEAEGEEAGPEKSYAYDEYDELYFEEEAPQDDERDPLEGFNRAMFSFNDGVDRYVLEPAATGFDYVVPDFAQTALRNGFENLRFPVNFFNELFQGKPGQAGKEFARFVVNTTVGLAGLMDPASAIGLMRENEDFGQTLGYWGVPPGPYLVLPILGPSNVRDTGGRIVDSGFRAIGFFIPFWASLSMEAVDRVNWRAMNREAIQAERKAALDWYAAVRSAYSQYRENVVQDKRGGTDAGDSDFSGYYPVFQEDEDE